MCRCYKPATNGYSRYGGKGITVCARWLGPVGFENFLFDMGDRPDGMTLDRYPNRVGNYEPGNCRWATYKEQNNGRSNNRILEYDGRKQTIMQWAEELHVPYTRIWKRLEAGWSVTEALELDKGCGRSKLIQ